MEEGEGERDGDGKKKRGGLEEEEGRRVMGGGKVRMR
jgi:hypothetical protein